MRSPGKPLRPVAKDEGLSPQQMLDAIRLYKQQVLASLKRQLFKKPLTRLSISGT
jgi:hypothetical protein